MSIGWTCFYILYEIILFGKIWINIFPGLNVFVTDNAFQQEKTTYNTECE